MTLSDDGRPSAPGRGATPDGDPAGRPLERDRGFAGLFERARMTAVRKRWLLLLAGSAAGYFVIVLVLLFQTTGLVLSLAISAAIVTFGPRVSADTMLSLYRAEPVATGQAGGLRHAIEALANRAGLAHEPALGIIPTLAVGAFSVGSGSRVALLMSEGLLRRMSLREIVTIAAHEIGHIRNNDLPDFALADTLVRVAQVCYYCGLAFLAGNVLFWLSGDAPFGWLPIGLLIAAPALNAQLQLALPRDHDTEADRAAAFLLGDISSLRTVARVLGSDEGTPLDDFRFPVPQRRSPLPSPLRFPAEPEARIAALERRPPSVLLPPLNLPDEPMISLLGFGPIEMRPRNRWPGVWF